MIYFRWAKITPRIEKFVPVIATRNKIIHEIMKLHTWKKRNVEDLKKPNSQNLRGFSNVLLEMLVMLIILCSRNSKAFHHHFNVTVLAYTVGEKKWKELEVRKDQPQAPIQLLLCHGLNQGTKDLVTSILPLLPLVRKEWRHSKHIEKWPLFFRIAEIR